MLCPTSNRRFVPQAAVFSSTCSPDRDRPLAIEQRWFSLRVTGEDKVARFDLIVAGKQGFMNASSAGLPSWM